MNAERKIIHVAPNFHYDVEYLKTYEVYRDMCLDNIVEAVRLLKENPGYTFMMEQVILLKEFWEKYPQFRQDLSEFIRQGRFEIACGMYCMPDMNIPSGESLIEQIREGKKWLKEMFAVDVRVCWIADCFGQHPQLPQLVKKCGYDYYFFSRGATDNEQGDFIWKGIDGSEIITHRGPKGYSTLILRSKNVINAADLTVARADGEQAVLNAIRPVECQSPTPNILCCNGGDFMRPQGGVINIVQEWNNEDYDCRFSTPLKFFEEVSRYSNRLPVIEDDFNPVNQGINSSRIKIKQNNRMMENLIMTCERMKLLYGLTVAAIERRHEGSTDYMLEEAKRLMLYNQFHDIISGTIVDQAYLDTMQRYKNALRLVNSNINNMFDMIVEQKNGAENTYIYVFNPSAYGRCEIVETTLDIIDTSKPYISLYNDAGEKIDVQSGLDTDKKRLNIIFKAEVPAMQISSYRLEYREKLPSDSSKGTGPLNEAYEFSNGFYSVKVESNGIISSLKNSKGEELVNGSRPYFNDLLMQADYGDLWVYNESPHNGAYHGRPVKQSPYLDGENGFLNERYSRSSAANGRAELVENGPARFAIKVEGVLKFWRIACSYTQYIYLYNHSPRIDFKTDMHCQGKNYRIRTCFPTSIRNGRIEHEIPFGMYERREEEYPAANWISCRNEAKGLLLLNRGLPGNNVHDGVMMLSLMRSTSNDYKCVSDLAFEEGEQFSFEYSIVPYDGDIKASVPWRHGQDINLRLIDRIYGSVPCNYHDNLIELDNSSIMLSRVYRCDKGIVIRLYEASGEDGVCTLKLNRGSFLQYAETDCLENLVGCSMEIMDNKIKLKFKPFEIKTIILS